MKEARIISFVALALVLSVSFTSCYYDNEEYLYPGREFCDTTNLSYKSDIAPIFTLKCNACHGGASPQAGLKTDNHSDLLLIINDGRLEGAINHQSGFQPMPQNGPKMSQCELDKIGQWINNGAPNN